MVGRDYDVAIVGASIAGCTAATFLARQGLRVALIDRIDEIASYKRLCTTQIQASATPTIRRLGLDHALEAAGAVRNGIDVWCPWGWVRDPLSGSDPEAAGYSIRRQKLDPLLRELASATPGVDLMLGRSARGLLRTGSRVVGVTTADREGRVSAIRARLVVAADGRGSRLAGLAGVKATGLGLHGRSGHFAYFRHVALSAEHRLQLWLLDPDVGYAVPSDDGLTILGYMVPTAVERPASRAELEAELIRRLGLLPDGPRFDPADRVSPVLSLWDYPTFWRRRPPPGLAFVGDAAVSADYLWGVGCGWAFQSAEWLAEATAGLLAAGAGDEALDSAAVGYRRRLRAAVLGHFLVISDFSRGRPFSPIERLLFSAGTKDVATATLLRQVGDRGVPVHRILTPRALSRAVSVNVRRETPVPEAQIPVRESVLDVNGVRTPVLESGPGTSGEAVVFVHGSPGSGRDWLDLMGPVGTFTRAVALDLPGFGRAGKPVDFDYTVAGYSAHLGQVLDQLGIEWAHLVLHDFGGPWALAWAAEHPDRFASAVLINSGVLVGYRWHPLARLWRTPRLGEMAMATASKPAFRFLLQLRSRRRFPRAFVERAWNEFDPGTRRAILRLYRATGDPSGDACRLSPVLAPLRRPALVIWGARDPYIPLEQAGTQRVTFPDAEVVVLAKSGHWPFVDAPGAVHSAVIPFLRRVVSQEREGAGDIDLREGAPLDAAAAARQEAARRSTGS